MEKIPLKEAVKISLFSRLVSVMRHKMVNSLVFEGIFVRKLSCAVPFRLVDLDFLGGGENKVGVLFLADKCVCPMVTYVRS